jgi:hypothetical protein
MTRSKPESGRGRRALRWYQYRLRTLFLLMLAASIAMGAVAKRIQTAGRQRDAVAAIWRSYGWVQYDDVVNADLHCNICVQPRPPPGPKWLRKLLGDDFFRTVVAAGVYSDDGFEHLKKLGQLRTLTCSYEVTEAGLAHLKELRQLRDLDLMGNGVAGAAFERIAALTELEGLGLNATHVGDAHLERLKAMTRLRTLGLVETKVTDAGLRHLEGLRYLEELYLHKTQIGDAGVAHLKGLTQLKRLGLSETRITDASAEYLTGLRNLVELELQGTSLSREAVGRIKEALPGCHVASTFDYAGYPPLTNPGDTPSTDDPFGAPVRRSPAIEARTEGRSNPAPNLSRRNQSTADQGTTGLEIERRLRREYNATIEDPARGNELRKRYPEWGTKKVDENVLGPDGRPVPP